MIYFSPYVYLHGLIRSAAKDPGLSYHAVQKFSSTQKKQGFWYIRVQDPYPGDNIRPPEFYEQLVIWIL